MGALTHPLLAAKIPRAGLDLVKGGSGQEDESIQDFVTRRFGKGFSDDLISAMVHGIYAGDVSKLSVRSTFGMLYHMEKDYGSIVLGMLMGGGAVETPWDLTLKEKIVKEMPDLQEFVGKTSIYSFTDGLEELSRSLEKDLVNGGRVDIHKESIVEKLDADLDSRDVRVSLLFSCSLFLFLHFKLYAYQTINQSNQCHNKKNRYRSRDRNQYTPTRSSQQYHLSNSKNSCQSPTQN